MNGFGIANLPYGAFRVGERAAIGVAYQESVLDLGRAEAAGQLTGLPHETREACRSHRLNELMSLGARHWRELRAHLQELLRANRAELTPRDQVKMQLPADIGDYTDFYASIHHATNVGRLFRPDQPLLPNYRWVPIAYHGRASSIILSGREVVRPSGQIKDADAPAPHFAPTRALDYELEVGLFAGPGNSLGHPVPIAEAEDRIFGLCLVNDWSARDIQAWEYQPLGPFLGKSFATSISPWVVTMEALTPFHIEPEARDVPPLPYLTGGGSALDLHLEVTLTSTQMRAQSVPPIQLARSNLRHLYWTPSQMLAHHTSNGCNLRPADLLATGTVSGPSPDALGSLLELTRRGVSPITLSTGETRRFLEDGDEVTIRGWCEREGLEPVSLGKCVGRVTAAAYIARD